MIKAKCIDIYRHIHSMVNDAKKTQLSQRVLPGYGFFGSSEELCLSLPVGQEIKVLRLCLQSGSRTFLALNAVVLFDADGEKVNLEAVVLSATLSTGFKKRQMVNALPTLLRAKPVRTAIELKPAITFKFSKPLHISRIDIANRDVFRGPRTVYLVVDAFLNSECVYHYKNKTSEGLIAQFDCMVGRLNKPIVIEQRNKVVPTPTVVSVTDAIVRQIREGEYACTMAELTSLLPVHCKKPVVTDNTLIVVGEIIARILATKSVFPTKQLRSFEKILCTPDSITRSVEYASTALTRITGRERHLVLAKHKIGIVNLVPAKNAYLQAMRALFKQMQQWDIPLVLCYGTLLGAVREGQFIPHDDDVDLLYLDDSDSRESMMKNRLQLIKRFRESGCSIVDSGINFHVKPPECKVYIDIFPSWSKQGQTHLMVERRQFRSVPTQVLLPTGSVELYEHVFPAPNNSAALLAYRYGESWEVSDPFYEWSWLLTPSVTSTTLYKKAA